MRKKTTRSTNKSDYSGLDLEGRRQKRRDILMQAGLELFGSDGYRATSVKNVCDHVNLTERYFYESFANREDLLVALFDFLAEDLDARLRQIVEDNESYASNRLEQVVTEFFHYIRDDKRRGRVLMFEVLGVSSTVDRHYQAGVRNLAALLEHPNLGLFADGSSRANKARRMLSIGLVGAVTQIAIQWVLEDFRTPKKVVIQKSLEIYQAVADAEHPGT